MASRFVSAGAIDPTTGEAAAAERTTTQPDDRQQKKPNDEWLAVEKELAAERRRREEQRSAAAGAGERSLFEVLQANKEAKQAAFEEANKIKNQFRALDDDEIDFLDEVKAKQRAEEERLRRETEEGLEAFRAAQRRGERAGEGDGEDGPEEWIAPAGGRKRKRLSKSVGIVKRRTASEGEAKEVKSKNGGEKTDSKPEVAKVEEKKVEARSEAPAKVAAPAAKPKIGLVSYDSDDDDD